MNDETQFNKNGKVKYAKEIGYKGTDRYIWVACIDCGKERWVQLVKNKPVVLRCISCANKRHPHPKHRGAYAWKGGRYIDKAGYVYVRVSPDNFFYPMVGSTGYVFEHRLVMAQHLGRCLQPWERIHHKDGVKDHNEYSNLKMTTAGSHSLEHSKGYRDGYTKGLIDGRNKQIEELKFLLEEQRKQIRLLRWEVRNNVRDTVKL